MKSGAVESHEEVCFHCGDDTSGIPIHKHDKTFCCHGCLSVYEILSENDLYQYYNLEKNPGSKGEDNLPGLRYAFLDLIEIKEKILLFSEGNLEKVKFKIPSIHCSSCIYLLENLHKIHPDILNSRVDFLKKEATIDYNSSKLSLRELAEILHKIGYSPNFNLSDINQEKKSSDSMKLALKLGIAGFCFGNVMLLSFPEYLSQGMFEHFVHRNWFGYLNILLSLPVILYSSRDYFASSIQGIRSGHFNIDIPIALGILTLFFRSLYEIVSETGSGYFDSLTGLVFFLLIGRWFQQVVYNSISFEKDYTSYFPIAVSRYNEKGESEVVSLNKIEIGDILLIHPGELIPCDATLMSQSAGIDYSFVTGESRKVTRTNGEKLFAGGKSVNQSFRIQANKKVSESYLVELWNQESFKKTDVDGRTILIDKISKHFSWVILVVATMAGVYWYMNDSTKIWQVVSAVLIVACPCALALSAPFTYGFVLRKFGKTGLFVKNGPSLERLSQCNHLIFDKTGTITSGNELELKTKSNINDQIRSILVNMSAQSSHPVSRAVSTMTNNGQTEYDISVEEVSGKGIRSQIDGKEYRLGKYSWVTGKNVNKRGVYLSENGLVIAEFEIVNQYRTGLKSVLKQLSRTFKISLLSGDDDSEQSRLKELFPQGSHIRFNQSPFDKLQFTQDLQKKGEHVLMVGDGLNDAGAIKQSDFGIALSENINHFSPACDAIVRAEKFSLLPFFVNYSKVTMNIITLCVTISFFYNAIGLSLAVTGQISPLVAAIIMPLSSISVVVVIVISVWITYKRKLIKCQS